jgi:hypothetical protein
MWKVEYDNDSNDDWFSEWWCVTDGVRSFTSKSEQDAKWLCDSLNGIVSERTEKDV